MNIQTNQTPAFKSIYISGKLSPSQSYNAKLVSSKLQNALEYDFLKVKKVDVCFLKPSRKEGGLRVRYFDNNNGTFVRDKEGNILETAAKAKKELSYNHFAKLFNKINKDMYGITHGIFKAPDWSKDPSKYAEEGKKVFESHDLSL